MKQYLIAAALLAGLSRPALAANQQQHYVVRDFTGYCAVLDSHPSPASNLKIIGKGYDSRDAAEQALKGQAHCTT